MTPAVDDAARARARSAVDAVATDPRPPTWDNVVEPLDDALDRLDRAWGAVNHLNAVVSTPALREAYNGNLPKVTAFHTDLGQDERLYARYKALAAAPAHAALHAGAEEGRRQRAARFPPVAAPSCRRRRRRG